MATLKVEIGFDAGPLEDSPTWTDVTGRVRRLKTQRGKARVLSTQQPGTISLVLSNGDGALSPENTASAYYPNVKPMRHVRVSVDLPDASGAPTIPIAYGYITSWGTSWPGQYDAEVEVQAYDALAVLNLAQVTASRGQELSSARVTAVLDAVGWPASLRDIETGQTSLQATELEADNPAEHLNRVADTENGLLYATADGNVRFVSRHGLIERSVGVTVSDAGPISYANIGVAPYDDTDLWNRVEVSSQGVETQVAEDTDSEGDYFGRVLNRGGLLHASTDEQLRHAQYLLVGFRQPALRVESIAIGEGKTDEQWADLFGLELGDKVLVERTPPAGDAISQRSYVESVGVTWSPTLGFDLHWSLVPTTRRTDFWLAGDAIQSRAGVTTRGGY